MGKQLTQKEERFCQAFIETGSATEAYKKAYSTSRMKPTTINRKAHDVVHRPHVKARIAQFNDRAADGAVLTRRQAMERLTNFANADIRSVVQFHTAEVEGGNVTVINLTPSDELDDATAAAIKSVTMTQHGPRVEMYDKLSAIQQLGRMQGWEASRKFDHISSDGSMTPSAGAAADEILKALRDKHALDEEGDE